MKRSATLAERVDPAATHAAAWGLGTARKVLARSCLHPAMRLRRAASTAGTADAPVIGDINRSIGVVPAHTVVFSQQKLHSALNGSARQGQELRYGFVLHARRRGHWPALGIITPRGESLALTPRLLAGLARRPLWLFGSAPVAIEAGDTVRGVPTRSQGSGHAPLASVLMHVEGLAQYAPGAQRVVEVEARVMAEALLQPLVILTTDRPAGWPA